ncbi:hypothetical protein RFI_34482 [Reticulomyxa filosa]|uniref:J domain-containing protein n=1 Tax=Reticulomyxa filosa TaxID=46433 RepID=X6LNK1_RETFI|nr:hypothetical protein RFI_34482 [Reticulomyxa filosa]|eukprot:ETO02931.1 hypothetical protein RFI_34482 [Reticulomyxa filosa]
MSFDSLDYYKILGVSRDASKATILKQYKTLAVKHHPDRNLNNKKQATEKFQQIVEACAVLRDPQRRQIYDKYGISGLKSNGIFPTSMTMEDLFDMIFKEDKENDNFPALACISMDLTLKECYNGVEKITEFAYESNCPLCSSDRYAKQEIWCTKCNGEGKTKIIADDDNKSVNGLYEKKRTLSCDVCEGKCKVKRCSKTCSGKLKGLVTVNSYFVMNKNLKVEIPAGSLDRDVIRTKYTCHKRQIDGVVLTEIRCKECDEYKIQGNNLYLIKPIKISLWHAFGGDDIDINHFGQTLFIKRAFTVIQNNEYYKVKKKAGHLFIKFEIKMPDSKDLDESKIKEIRNLLSKKKNKISNLSEDQLYTTFVELHQLNDVDKLGLNEDEDNIEGATKNDECRQM